MVEEDCTDVVQVSIQCEQAPSCLVGPNLDLVIVAAGHEEGLGSVEVDATNRTIMLFEPINQSAHSIVPELDGGRVERDENPRSSCIRFMRLGRRCEMRTS